MDTISKRLSAQDMVDPYIIEIQAPGGIFALIETRCKSVKGARDKVQGIAKKYGYVGMFVCIEIVLRCRGRSRARLQMNFLSTKVLFLLKHRKIWKISIWQLS